MTFKASIGTDPRVIYVQVGGDDNEDGLSLETAKATIQSGVDAINALSPPPSALTRAALIVSGAGLFAEEITFPSFTDVDAPNIFNIVSTGNTYELGTSANYTFNNCIVDDVSSSVLEIASELGVAVSARSLEARATSSVGITVSGITDELFINVDELDCTGTSSIGINHTATNGESEVYSISALNLQGDSTIGFLFDPTASTGRAVFDCESLLNVGLPTPTNTVGIRVNDGHLSAIVSEINATDALDVTGGTLAILSTCVTGDITVAVGSTLVCEIAEFTGTITNNGTITGRIGDQYFTAGIVTTSDTLTNNTLIVGNGGVDVDNRANATLTDDGTTLTLDLQSPVITTGTSRLTLSDSTGSLKGELEYLESSDTVEMLFTTSQFSIGAGPGASQIEFLGNDLELEYRTAGTDNAFTIDMTGGPDTNPPFIIDNGGTNGAVVNFFVGGRTPLNNVTADPGSVYFRSDGVDSDIYLHRGASASNTDWIDILANNVDGPATSTLNSIPSWGNTTGSLLDDNSWLTVDSTATVNAVRMESPGVTGSARTELYNSSSVLRGTFGYAEPLDQFSISSSTAGGVSVFLSDVAAGLVVANLVGTDQTDIFRMTTSSTNGGAIVFYAMDRDPTGNLSEDGGAFAFREDGVNSNLYIKQSATATTADWNPVVVSSTASSTDNALATYDGTGGGTVQQVAGITAVGTTSPFMTFEVGGAGATTGINFNDSSSVLQTNFFYNETADLTELIIDAGSGIEIFALNGNIRNRASSGDIILELDTTTSVIDIIATNHDDQDVVMRFASSDGTVEFIVGEDTPVGIVSATGGTYYYRDDETDSNLLIKKSAGAASTAGWQGVISSATASSTANAALRLTDTTGFNAESVDNILFVDNGDNIELRMIPLAATGQSDLFFYDDVGTGIVGTLRHNLNSGDMLLENFDSGGSLLFSVNGSSELTMTGAGRTFTIDGAATSDTVALLQLDTGGTNGAVTDIHCGDRSPEGNVNADPGSLYFRSDGVSSDIYIHRAASAGTTGWVDVLETGLKTNLVSSTNEAMCIWDGTGADTLTQDPLILSVSSASAGALEILSPSAAGFAGITFENSLSNTVFDIIFTETSGTTTIESGNGGDLDLTSAAQMNINTGDDIIISANSNANSVTINADFVFNGTTSGAEFDIECPAADEFAFIQFQNASSAARMQIGYDQDVDQASIQTFQTSTDFLIRSEDQPIELNVNATDDSQSVRISNTENSFDIWSRLNDPQGSISGVEGDIVVAGNGFADSFIYFNKGSSSNTSWAIVELQQKAFEFVGTTSTLSQSRNRVLLNPVAGDITLSLPTPGTASRQNGFEQTLTKTVTNTDIITIDTPGFYGHTGNFVMSKRGDSVTYMQDNSANVILYTNRRVIGIMERTGGAENSIAGATGADIVLDGFNSNEQTYEGLCEPDQANDRIVFPDVENLTDGDLYELELNLVCRWSNNSVINFHATVDDSGISTNYNIVMEQQSLGTADEMTLFGKTLIRTGTNDAVSLDTSVEIEFTLATGATLFFKQGWLKLTKWEGR